MNTTTGIYRGFIDAVNNKDLDAVDQFADVSRYRENCIGFTHGFVDWEQSKASIRRVWKGLPDLRVELAHIMADNDVALAHGTVRGTATGRLYGARHQAPVRGQLLRPACPCATVWPSGGRWRWSSRTGRRPRTRDARFAIVARAGQET